MINTILIANRGEIASRIIRTCRKMGIKSVAVFSDADSEALYVSEADVAVHIGESSPTASYLDQDKIIAVAKEQGAEAIHPGYGFLSENAGFAQKCSDNQLIFIGPHPKAIAEMGSKSNAKAIMKKHGVPVIPGYQGEDQSIKTLMDEAENVGYPMLLKATAGGGGKGMRIVKSKKDLKANIEAAKRESMSSFGDDELIIERYIANGRHIEFQILGDKHGNAIHILERECTIQRRYQKVLEESPSPAMNDALRTAMGDAAVLAAKALDYDNAGTVEFIYDENTGDFFFLEVNTRLQVEHPVTEEVTGLDLVQLQIECAEGHPLTLSQDDIKADGYAIEARLYSEDVKNDFLPATGKITHWSVPEVEGLRIETAVSTGSEISIHYDPMIAKVIVWDKTRASAHRKMSYVLKNLKCLGLTTNQDFLLHLFQQSDIQQGNYDTHYLENNFDADLFGVLSSEGKKLTAIATVLAGWKDRDEKRGLLRGLPSGWRSTFYEAQSENLLFSDEEYKVSYRYLQNDAFEFEIGELSCSVDLISVDSRIIVFRVDSVQHTATLSTQGNDCFIHLPDIGNVNFSRVDRFPSKEVEKVDGGYNAPMPSQIVKILVGVGDKVKTDEALMVISSMKMENTITASKAGKVAEIYVEEGESVEADTMLLKVD